MTQRREFLRQASLLAAGSLAASSLEAQASATATATASAAPQGADAWDMSWVDRITGKYRMAFDAPQVSDGTVLHQTRNFLSGYGAVYGLADGDLTAVMVIRHAAIAMVLSDALWADGTFGEKDKLKDPQSGDTAKRNPFINVAAGSRYALTWPDGALDTLMTRGVIVLACDLAMRNVAGGIARSRSIPREEAAKLVQDSLLPGVYRMPTGVFATCRAQAAGCGVMHAV